MHRRSLRTIAFLTLTASASIGTPVLAGSPYGDAAPSTQAAGSGSQPQAQRRAGFFSCSFHEQRTKLERKNCGGHRF